jgi:hypothetical protein
MPKSVEFADLLRGLEVDEGVRLNYSPDADPTEVTTRTDYDLDGEATEAPRSDEPPPAEDWPDVAQPAGGTQ